MSKYYPGVKAPSPLTLWHWLPILLVTGIGIQLFEATSLWVVHLVIPIAAVLGSRFGSRALAVVAVGGLPLVLQWRYGALFGGACLDLYIVSLIVCRLAGAPWPRLQPPTHIQCCLIFLLLPLSVGFYGADDGEFTWQLILVFDALFYLLLFLVGASGFSAARTMMILAGFTIFGMALELLQLPQDAQQLLGGTYAELPLLGYTELRTLWMEYELDSPASLFAALGWLFAGSQVASLNGGKTAYAMPWHRTWLPVVLLAFVGIGAEANTFIATLITGTEPPSAFMLLGAFYALPCAALLAGLLLRWRGIWLVLVLVGLFLVLDALIRGGFDTLDMQFYFNLSDPAAVLGFGVLGIGLRNRLSGTSDVLWSWQWASYAAIVTVLLPVLFSIDSVPGLLWMILSGTGAIMIGKWLALLRKRLLGWLPPHGGWLALLWLLGFVFIAATNMDLIMEMGSVVEEWLTSNIESLRAGEGWYEPDGKEFMAMLILAGGMVLFFSILKRCLRDAGSCGRDVLALVDVMKGRQRYSEQAVASQQGQKTSDSLWSKIGNLFTGPVAVIRNVAAGIVLAILVMQLWVWFYPRDGIGAMIAEWFAPDSEAFTGFGDSTVVSQPLINTYLLQAAREAYAQVPATIDAREGALATEWFNDANEADVRQRVAINIGETLESYDLSVNLRIQKKGLFGLWIEQGRYWDPSEQDFVGTDIYPRQQEIADGLLARARVLASASAD